jgi:hypothetical protein
VSNFSQIVNISKINEEKRIVYGKVLVPDKFDSQGDIISKEDIEKAAHNFLINLQKAYIELLHTGSNSTTKASQIGFMHKVFKGVGGFGYIVESYIDQEGSWVLATKITDDKVWQMIKDGIITGYSVGGRGKRTPVKEVTINE